MQGASAIAKGASGVRVEPRYILARLLNVLEPPFEESFWVETAVEIGRSGVENENVDGISRAPYLVRLRYAHGRLTSPTMQGLDHVGGGTRRR
jgi:hypothetical protein